MASTWPAEFLGIAAARGRIAAGLRAELVELDRDQRVVRCWCGARTGD
jgi:N-acetylglucosamine-6-phosphate deacetylase